MPNYKIMMKLLPKFKRLMYTSKDVSVLLDLVETMLGLLRNYVENHETNLDSMKNDMPNLIVFIMMPLYFNKSEEFTCAMMKNIQRFLDLSSSISRAVLYSKLTPFTKVV